MKANKIIHQISTYAKHHRGSMFTIWWSMLRQLFRGSPEMHFMYTKREMIFIFPRYSVRHAIIRFLFQLHIVYHKKMLLYASLLFATEAERELIKRDFVRQIYKPEELVYNPIVGTIRDFIVI
jgi:hypothetical protein